MTTTIEATLPVATARQLEPLAQNSVTDQNSVNVATTDSSREAAKERQANSSVDEKLPAQASSSDKEEFDQAVTQLNAAVQSIQRDLQFRVDTDLGRTIISVVDSETKEVIRQIPGEDVIERARQLEGQENTEDEMGGLLLQVVI